MASMEPKLLIKTLLWTYCSVGRRPIHVVNTAMIYFLKENMYKLPSCTYTHKFGASH
jgi:hypothetical protein